jgi:hypothetical protein
MSSMSLAQAIEAREIGHMTFERILQAMASRIDSALAGRAPVVEWVVGPSRAGKSMLLRALERMYPARKVDGRREIPVLRVPIMPGVSPKELPSAPLEPLLGLRNIKGSVKTINAMMTTQLRLAGTRVVLWEEASHIVDVGTKMPPRAAGDFFKDSMDEVPVTHILFGLPRLEKLMQSNEQLRLRAKKRWEFRPYDWMELSERRAFAGVVRTFMDMFSKAGCPIEVHFECFVQHCYLFSGGLVGVVSAFHVQLAEDAERRGLGSVTFEHCAAAAERVEAAGHPDWPAFQRVEVTPVELNQAYAEVLRVALMAQPRRG